MEKTIITPAVGHLNKGRMNALCGIHFASDSIAGKTNRVFLDGWRPPTAGGAFGFQGPGNKCRGLYLNFARVGGFHLQGT